MLLRLNFEVRCGWGKAMGCTADAVDENGC